MFKDYGIEFLPMNHTVENLTKPKFSEYFDIVVCGFGHVGFLTKEKKLTTVIKKGGTLFTESPRFLVPKKK